MKTENLKTQDLLIYSKKKADEMREQKREYNNKLRECIAELLRRVGATSRDKKLVIEEDYCSWVVSGDFDEDVTDARISAMWIEDDFIFCDLYAYYIGETLENELLANAVNNDDYDDIADNLSIFIEEEIKSGNIKI